MAIYRDDVRRYLLENYDVLESDLDAALGTDASRDFIATGERLGSHPFYPGDQIAEAQGWSQRDPLPEDAYPGYPEDDDDDDDDW